MLTANSMSSVTMTSMRILDLGQAPLLAHANSGTSTECAFADPGCCLLGVVSPPLCGHHIER